ncbi:MAG: DeoR/GlpR family DNA-binding transcription regulator [Christensenellales bacterium]
MLQIERLKTIENMLDEQPAISIADLEKALNISRATIYRDLKVLHRQDKLHFTRGGVTRPRYASGMEQPYLIKQTTNAEQKKRIAESAVDFIKPNSTIFMDSSTTVTEMSKWLLDMKDVRVITNDVLIAAGLSAAPGIEVIMLGGVLRKGFYTVTGLFAEQNLSGVQIDMAFMGCDAINLANGCMLTNMEEVALKRQVMDISAQSIVLCDHTKFDAMAFISFCPIDRVTYLIVGRELSEQTEQEFLEAGVDISCV